MQKRRERREERYRSEEGGGERNISIQIPTSSQQISNSWLHLGRFAQSSEDCYNHSHTNTRDYYNQSHTGNFIASVCYDRMCYFMGQ